MTGRDRGRPSSPDPEVRPTKSEEKVVRVDGVDLCVQTFGDPAYPAILLIGGSAASMLGWEEGFCEHLAAGDRFVVRYDHRDTGHSTSYEPGAPPYTARDLSEDAIGLLDVFGLGRAHLVGMSMGGAIIQFAALDHPDRVASITLISTTPGGPDLSPMSERIRSHFEEAVVPNWSDREAVIDAAVALKRVYAGSAHPFDEAAARELAARDYDRNANVASSQTNHFAMADPGVPVRERFGEIGGPTLVIHGTEDPLLPLDHALAMESEIPGARLLALEGVGHELPPASWSVVVPAILEHTSDWRPTARQETPRDTD